MYICFKKGKEILNSKCNRYLLVSRYLDKNFAKMFLVILKKVKKVKNDDVLAFKDTYSFTYSDIHTFIVVDIKTKTHTSFVSIHGTPERTSHLDLTLVGFHVLAKVA